jgi:hypothetical protein
MSPSGSSKQCPHCGTLLLEETPFCRTCGWQLAPTEARTAPLRPPASEYIPYEGPETPESWAIDQPAFIPPDQPRYPFSNQTSYPFPPDPRLSPTLPGIFAQQGQFGPAAGYTPAPPAPAPPARHLKALLLSALVLVLLGAAAGGIFLALRGASTSPPVLDRHGLQSNVPLPDNIAFQYKHTVTQGTLTANEWIWKVSNSEPTSIQKFYQDRLPRNGWTHVQALQGNETLGVAGCQGDQVLIVGISKHLQDSDSQGMPITTDAPVGGSALGIALTDNQALRQNFCQAP